MDAITEMEQVRGPVLRPGDDGFDEECSGFQAGHRHRPDLVVVASGPDDVRVAVAHATARGLPLAVQATGHGLVVPIEGGVLVSTRGMTGLEIDPVARTARIGAGVRWEQVIDAAGRHGLAPPSGSSPDVGAVGYTLGGGLGILARTYGWAVDHVRALDLVAPDGQPVHVTADAEPELFRALRGGGKDAGLGVVTAMEIGLLPVARLYGGRLTVATEHLPALLAAYRDWTADLPDALTSSVGMVPYPDLEAVPAPLRGRYVGAVRIAFDGPAVEGERWIAPLRDAVPLLADSVRDLPFTESASIHDDPRHPHPYTGTNALLRELDPAALEAVWELAGADSPLPCIVQVNHLGGALARPPAVADAVEHREATHLLRVLSVLDGSALQLLAHRRLLDALAPWTLGCSPGFVMGPQDPAR